MRTTGWKKRSWKNGAIVAAALFAGGGNTLAAAHPAMSDAQMIASAMHAAPARVAPARAAAARGIRGLQERVKTAARSYLTNGNAAVDKSWEEF